MGSNQSFSNPIFADWKPHPTLPDVFCNQKSEEQVYRQSVILEASQEHILQKRMAESNEFIIRIRFYQALQFYKNNKNQVQQIKFDIFTDRTTEIGPKPVNCVLPILKGLRALILQWGKMRVCSEMVKVNHKNEIKIWVHPNPIIHQVWKPADSEKQTVADICQILQKLDEKSALLLSQCQSLNQCINLYLTNLTSIKWQPNNKNQPKFEKKLPQANKGEANYLQNIRSTRETDESGSKLPSYIENIIAKKDDSKQRITPTNNTNNIDLLHTSKSANHLFKSKSPDELSKKIMQQKLMSDNKDTKNSNVEGNSSKQKNTEVDESFRKKKFKPLEYKFQIEKRQFEKPKSNIFLTHYLSPKGFSQKKEGQSFNAFKNPYSHQNYQRNSQLNQQYLDRARQGRPSDLSGKLNYKSFEQAEVEESQRIHTYSKSRNKKQQSGQIQLPEKIPDMSRNRTQEFNQCAFGSSGKKNGVTSSRFQTKQLGDMKKSDFLENIQIAKRLPTSNDDSSDRKILEAFHFKLIENSEENLVLSKPSKLKKHLSEESEPIFPFQEKKESHFEEKKAMKKKMVNTLREELGGVLGISSKPSSSETVKSSQKSVKDMVLQRRVEEKKKNFAELKSETLKLLNN